VRPAARGQLLEAALRQTHAQGAPSDAGRKAEGPNSAAARGIRRGACLRCGEPQAHDRNLGSPSGLDLAFRAQVAVQTLVCVLTATGFPEPRAWSASPSAVQQRAVAGRSWWGLQPRRRCWVRLRIIVIPHWRPAGRRERRDAFRAERRGERTKPDRRGRQRERQVLWCCTWHRLWRPSARCWTKSSRGGVHPRRRSHGAAEEGRRHVLLVLRQCVDLHNALLFAPLKLHGPASTRTTLPPQDGDGIAPRPASTAGAALVRFG